MMNSESVNQRLPCRGCSTTCQYRHICGGKPWRLDKSVFSSKLTVVIYGGSGFVGTAIAEKMAAAGHAVHCLSRTGTMPSHLAKDANNWAAKVTWQVGDVAEPDQVLLAKADLVITTVGSPPLPTFSETAYQKQYQANGAGNLILLKACIAASVPKVIVIGASVPSVLRRKSFAYYQGKQDVVEFADTAYQETSTHFTVIQPAVIYGTRFTASGAAIPLGFLKYASAAASLLAGIIGEPLGKKIRSVAPVSVEAIAHRCIEISASVNASKGAALDCAERIDNQQLLQYGH